MIKVFTTTSDRSKCSQLERSLKHFNYDYHIVEHQWNGFLDKIHQAYKYLKSLEGYTYFLYTDAWDTFALGKIDKVPDGLTLSAERACYPHPEKEALYPKHDSPWHFVNGGGWCGEIKAFIEMYEACPPKDELNDQVYLTDRFLSGGIKLDYDCEIFQTIAFCPESDFEYYIVVCLGADCPSSGRLRNTITGKSAKFIHGNGKTDLSHIYKLLP